MKKRNKDAENDSVTEKDDETEAAEGDATEHEGAVQETNEDNSVDAFNTAFAGLSEKVKNTYRQLSPSYCRQ